MFDFTMRNEPPVTSWADEPGTNLPMSEYVAKVAGGVVRSTPPGMATLAGIDILRNPEPYGALFTAAERQTRLVDNVFAEERSKEEAYDRQIAAVKEATGVELQNPLRGGYAQDARRRIRDEVRAGGMSPIDAKGGIPEYQRRLYDENLAAVREKHPDLPQADLAVSTIARSIAAEAEGVKPSTDGLDPVAAFGASMAGGLWAGRRDPLFVGSLFAGPTAAVGATTTARIASAGLFQGLFNAGLSALEQPTVQAWRADIGAKSGVLPALENVGLAFVFGAIPGAIFRGAHEATAARGAIERVMAGRPEPGDFEVATKATQSAATPERPAAHPEAHGLGWSVDPDRAAPPADRPSVVSKTEFRPFGPSEQLGVKSVSVDGEMVARADVTMGSDGNLVIQKIETLDAAKRRGYATKLVRDLAEEFPNAEIRTTARTDAGSAFFRGAFDSESGNVPLDTRRPVPVDQRAVRMGEQMAEADKALIPPAGREVAPELHDDMMAAALKRADDPDAPAPEAVAALRQPDPALAARVEEANPQTIQEAQVAATEVLEERGTKATATRLSDELAQPTLEAPTPADLEALPKPARNDPLGKIPYVREDGTPTTITAAQAAKIGERESTMSMLVRSCK